MINLLACHTVSVQEELGDDCYAVVIGRLIPCPVYSTTPAVTGHRKAFRVTASCVYELTSLRKIRGRQLGDYINNNSVIPSEPYNCQESIITSHQCHSGTIGQEGAVYVSVINASLVFFWYTHN